ncbi:MAG: bile acid:sodium symporter [Nannocystaceae bacterium]|nr:bile acid:sodium symporter [Nannocystaceae bacterium]
MLGGFEKALLGLLLVVLMTGMGATLDLTQFRQIVRRPRGVLVGLASQFGWMPLVAFALARGLDLPPAMAIGLVLVGCTPGGTTSNLFTYYARADLALSISMTVVSTVVAVALMPILLVLYAQALTGTEFSLPLGSIVTTLMLVLVPVGIGMLLRARRPKAAAKAERAGSISGVVVLVLLVGSTVLDNHAVLTEIPAAGYIAAAALGIIGMTLGWTVARLLGLDVAKRRAVALETGIQNSPLAFAVVIASFPESQQDQMLWIPMLYALFVLLSASAVTLVWRRADADPTPR